MLFAELQRLRVDRVLILLVCACGFAFLVNMARTYGLARIRFDYGETAFTKAHDGLGLLAFVIAGAFFHLLSGRLSATPRGKVLRTVKS